MLPFISDGDGALRCAGVYFCPETKVPKILHSKGEMAQANGNKVLNGKF